MLVAVTGGGVIAVLAGVLAVALAAVSFEGALVMHICTVIRQGLCARGIYYYCAHMLLLRTSLARPEPGL